MGRMQRSKGARIEREIVELHRSLGLRAERVPLSGASRYQGNGTDVDIYPFGPDGPPLCGEVKACVNGEVFATLEQWLATTISSRFAEITPSQSSSRLGGSGRDSS